MSHDRPKSPNSLNHSHPISLPHSTNVHYHHCPLAATPSMSSTQLSHYLSNITLTLLQKWGKKKKNRGNIFRSQNLWLNVHAQYLIWLLSAPHQKLQPKTTKTILFYFFIFAKPQGIYSFRTKQPRKRISQIKLKQKVYNKRNNKLFISMLPKKNKK